jgi:hypothetical protein
MAERSRGKLKLTIDTDALAIVVKTLLSCRCPVSPETERALFRLLTEQSPRTTVNYEILLDIIERDGDDTAIHRLKEFCIQSLREHRADYVITDIDVLAHFCGSYHWKLIARQLATSYRMITNLSEWLVGHMMIPVIVQYNDGLIEARYTHSDGQVVLQNLFAADDVVVRTGNSYAVHFASVIVALSDQQTAFMHQQLDLTDGFVNARRSVERIDYRDFQRFGDYREMTGTRYGDVLPYS